MNWVRQFRQIVATGIAREGDMWHEGMSIKGKSSLGKLRRQCIEKSALA